MVYISIRLLIHIRKAYCELFLSIALILLGFFILFFGIYKRVKSKSRRYLRIPDGTELSNLKDETTHVVQGMVFSKNQNRYLSSSSSMSSKSSFLSSKLPPSTLSSSSLSSMPTCKSKRSKLGL